MILLDANIALRLASPRTSSTLSPRWRSSVLHSRGETFAIVPQTIYEFWAVATRPLAVNGLGLSVPACQTEIGKLMTYTTFLPDQPGFICRMGVAGRHSSMPGQGIPRCPTRCRHADAWFDQILTFNVADFQRYPGLTVIDPAAP